MKILTKLVQGFLRVSQRFRWDFITLGPGSLPGLCVMCCTIGVMS